MAYRHVRSHFGEVLCQVILPVLAKPLQQIAVEVRKFDCSEISNAVQLFHVDCALFCENVFSGEWDNMDNHNLACKVWMLL